MSKLVLVPAEADARMCDMGEGWNIRCGCPNCDHTAQEKVGAGYSAMLSARPPVSHEEVEGLARVIGPNCYDGPDENGAFSRCVRPLCSCRTLARAVLSHFGAKVE